MNVGAVVPVAAGLERKSTESGPQPGALTKGGGAYGQVIAISGIRSRMSNSKHMNEVTYDEIRKHTEFGTALWCHTWSVGSLQHGRPKHPARERQCRWVGPRQHRRPLLEYHTALVLGGSDLGRPTVRGRSQVLGRHCWESWHCAARWGICLVYHQRMARIMVLCECSGDVL
jgi:hypothetical protein